MIASLGAPPYRARPVAHLALLALLLSLFLWPAALQAQEGGTIEGQISAPGGEELPPALEVELLFLPNGQGPPVISAQPLAAGGAYRFTGVDPSPQHRYLVRVRVGEEDNFSELIAFAPDESTKRVDLTLFARTTDASALTLRQVNYVMDVQADGWLVVGLYQYENTGEQIIENLTTPPVSVPVPPEAQGLQFSQGVQVEQVTPLANGFAYSGPFAPGNNPIVFSYLLPYREGEQQLTLPIGEAAPVVRILIPELGQRTVTDDLEARGTQALNERSFELFEREDVPIDSSATFRFSDLPAPPAPEPGSEAAAPAVAGARLLPISPLERLPWWAPLVPALLAAGGLAIYVGLRPEPSQAEQRRSLRARRDTLVAEIATLDIRYESGAIGEQTHRRQRALLKQELKELLLSLGTGDSAPPQL